MKGASVVTCCCVFLHLFMKVVCDSGATIVWREFNAEQDAEAIHGAIRGWGTNEGKLIQILGTRTSHQRKEISAAYNRKYGNPEHSGRSAIIDDLEGDTSGTFEDILVQLTNSIEELLAKEIHQSLHRRKDWTFLEIICTSDKEMLDRIRASYVAEFKVSLAQEIENAVLDVPTRLLLLRAMGGFDLPPRSSEGLDDKAVRDQIKSIPEKKEECLLEKNGKFFTLLSKESFAQIRTVVKEYGSKHKDDPVEKRIKENCEDESLRMAYTTIVNYAEDPAKYYATVLKDAMNGLGTKEQVLNRIIIWRSEIDLAKVAQSFHELTHKSLVDWVKGDTSGDYQDILLQLINGNNKPE